MKETIRTQPGSTLKSRALATLALALALAPALIPAAGCRLASPGNGAAGTGEGDHVLALPELAPIDLGSASLHVVATTSIIGDVVARVGGEAIDLAVLLAPGMDSHSYQPGAQDLIAVENADLIFVNGWDLEGSLVDDLQAIGGNVLVVPISAGIVPLIIGADVDAVGESGDEQGRPDPHVWFDIANVKRWVENVVRVLSGLDPANAGVYADRAAAYLVELSDLEALTETRLDLVPPENRKLVTNHDALGYFAHAYGFEVVATVIPAASTLAEPSAGDLVDLIEAMEANGVCTIFSEASVSDELAQAAAAELRGCRQVMVAALYTEALGPPGSGADSYIGMFTSNVETIVEGLK